MFAAAVTVASPRYLSFFFGFFVSLRIPLPLAIVLTPSSLLSQARGGTTAKQEGQRVSAPARAAGHAPTRSSETLARGARADRRSRCAGAARSARPPCRGRRGRTTRRLGRSRPGGC